MTKKRIRATNVLATNKVEEMFLAYVAKPSATYVAEACDVNFRTARRYIEEGDPSRGIKPFRDRLVKINENARTKLDATIEAERLKSLRAAQQLEDKWIEALDRVHINPEDLDPRHLEVIVRIKQQLLGQAPAPEEETADGDKKSKRNFTPEEARAMAEALLDLQEKSREPAGATADEGST